MRWTLSTARCLFVFLWIWTRLLRDTGGADVPAASWRRFGGVARFNGVDGGVGVLAFFRRPNWELFLRLLFLILLLK